MKLDAIRGVMTVLITSHISYQTIELVEKIETVKNFYA
jgi:hypothetical protein